MHAVDGVVEVRHLRVLELLGSRQSVHGRQLAVLRRAVGAGDEEVVDVFVFLGSAEASVLRRHLAAGGQEL